MKVKEIINRWLPSRRWKRIAITLSGLIVGGGLFFLYMLRAHTYLGDDPAACVNCHIMGPYYATQDTMEEENCTTGTKAERIRKGAHLCGM